MAHRRIAAVLAFCTLAIAGMGAHAGDTKGVIELFTSQGCSSCPPADKVLAEYAAREDILALSFNVDIWDWIGWKDTLASPDFTERQRAYADRDGRQVYTPQAVINGSTDVVGSNRSAIEAALKSSGLTVPVSLASNGDSIEVHIGEGAGRKVHATLWLVMYDTSVTVPIERGENTGKTITYANVVRKVRPIAMWKGKEMLVDLPKSEIDHAKVSRCAVLLQAEGKDGAPGPILGAATIRAGW